MALLLAMGITAMPALASDTTAQAAAPQRATPPAALSAIDLPACEVAAPGTASAWSLGLVQPGTADDVLQFAARLTLERDDVEACRESWNSVLPRFTPFARQLERGHGLALYALAFVLVAVGLRAFTPRDWWRRTRALGLLALAGLTWMVGSLLLAGFHLAQGQQLVYATVVSLRAPQEAAPRWHDITDARALEALLVQQGIDTRLPRASRAQAAQQPQAAEHAASATAGSAAAGPAGEALAPQGSYRVAHRLNLRQGPGTHHAWLATLNRGDTVTVTGQAQGDWWPIKAANGQPGWASSLWLRRADEGLPRLEGAQRG